MNRPFQIMIVDDHPIVREGLSAVISQCRDFYVVAQASTSAEAIARFREFRPDLTLMDIRLPDKNGIETIAALQAEFPRSRFLVMTTYADDEHIYRAVLAGTRGFLMKDADPNEVIDAMRTVAGGGSHMPPGIASRLTDRMGRPTLTTREMDVLKLMAIGFSNQEIGARLFVAESTVKSHVNSVLRKMDVMDRTQAVLKALEQGLVKLQHAHSEN